MSVKLMLCKKHCQQQELGAYSFCRHNLTRRAAVAFSNKDTKLYLDLEEYLRSCENLPPDSVLTIPVNFGVVPVDKKVFYDISLTHPRIEKIPRRLQLEYDTLAEEKFDDVFLVAFNNSNTTRSCFTNENKNAVYIRGKTERESTFRVFFKPELPSMLYNDSFALLADKVPMRFQCRGFSEGPSLCFSQNIINFGGVVTKTEVKHTIEMHNLSCCVAYFQFDVDNNRSLFKVCPTSGSLASMQTMQLEVIFKPEKPQCYYKRIHCTIHHQSSQFLDVIGIAMPNTSEFINKEIYFGISAEDTRFIPFPSISDDEYFKKHLWGIKFNQDYINFGFHDIYSEKSTSSKKLTVSSTLPYDAIIYWIFDSSSIFSVEPQEKVIETAGSFDFDVQFMPKFPDSFFSGQLECYVHPVGYTWPSEWGPPWVCGNDKIKRKRGKTEENPNVSQDQQAPTKESVKKKKREKSKCSQPTSTNKAKAVTDIENVHGKSEKLNYVPLEIRLQHHSNNSKGKLILLKPKRQTHASKPSPENIKSEKSSASSPAISAGGGDTLKTVNTNSSHESSGGKSSKSKEKYGLNEKIKTSSPETCESNENSEECEDSSRVSGKHENGESEGSSPILRLSTAPQLSSKESEQPMEVEKSTKKSRRKNRKVENLEDMKANTPEYVPLIYDIITKRKLKKSIPLPQSIVELALPLCRSINITGHTFGMTNLPHVSQVEVPSRVAMGPTLPQKRVCGTAIIRNKSDLPAFFDVKYLDKKIGYRMKPRSGVIPGGKSQIFVTNLSPRLLNTSKYTSKALVNLNLQDNFQMELSGMAQIPHLTILLCYDSITDSKGIVCPITIPGCSTDTYIEFINYSRFHYRYILEPRYLDREDWSIFIPTPNKGYLTPNERVRIQWKFVPVECKMYKVCWRFRFSVVKSGNDLTLTKGSDYELKMHLTGVSQPCTIQASVNMLDFDLVQIFDKDTKTFNVKNMGKFTVRAKLIVQHEQWLKNFPKGLVTVTPAKVILAAGETIQITATVRPTRVDIQKFFIEYQLDLTERDEYGDVLFETDPVRLVDIKFMGDHALFKVTDIMMISRHPLWDTEHCWSMFSLTRLNELLAPLRNTARENTMPTIETVSFRFPPAPVNSEPAIFTLMLSSVSDSLNRNATSHWEIVMENTPEPVFFSALEMQKSNKQRRSTVFGGDVRDSSEFLSALWKERKTSAKQPVKSTKLGSRNNSTPNRFSTEANILLPSKSLFSIVPTHGSIKNKSNQQVTFKFSYNEAGTHKMTILLRVYPAIFVWVELFGRTLEPNQAYIQYMYKETMRLHPVSLSDMDPPIQMFWAYNGGNVPCTYEIDQKTFELWKENNYGHSVMECLNPIGKVPPRSWFPIKIRFSPLEYDKYTVPLKIYSENHDETTVSLVGNVSLDSAMQVRLSCVCESSCTRKSAIINPLVPVSICPTVVSIQHFIPTGEKCTSIVFVTNLSSKHKMSYSWPEFIIEGGGCITFHPQSKLLEPNEKVACIMQVKAGKVSATFSCMIRCMIEDETSNAQYEEDFELYMAAQRNWRAKHFYNKVTATDYKKFAPDRMPIKPEKPENFSRVLAVSVYIGTAFGMLDKLPPEEISKLPFSDPICQPLMSKTNSLFALPFSRHMSQEIISQMLWEIIHAPTFEGFSRRVSRRQPPFFYEYKNAEDVDPGNEDVDESRVLPTQTTEEILEYAIFNMFQEMSQKYSQNDQTVWYDLNKSSDLEETFQEERKLGPCFVRFPPKLGVKDETF